MHQERLMMTDGDNLAASHLGQQATDAAVAFRHNKDVEQKLREDALGIHDVLNKTSKALHDSVDPNDKTFPSYVKRVLQQHFPNNKKTFTF